MNEETVGALMWLAIVFGVLAVIAWFEDRTTTARGRSRVGRGRDRTK